MTMRAGAGVVALWLATAVASAQDPAAADAGVPVASEEPVVEPTAEPQPPASPPPSAAPSTALSLDEQIEAAIERVLEPEQGDAEREYPYLSFNVRAEIEYVNVEGEGGFMHADDSVIAPERRAAYVDLDKATVDVGLHLRPWLTTRSELRFETDEAFIDRIYLTADILDDALDTFDLELEVGRNRPMTRGPGRRVETYSPLGKTFWRGREWHAGLDLDVDLGPLTLRLVTSIASTRPLGDESMGEDDNLPVTAYSHSDVLQDSTPEAGILLGVRAFGARLEGFAHFGELLDDAGDGAERLQRVFDTDYLLVSCGLGVTAPCPAFADRTSRWYGARLAFEKYGIFLMAEVIQNRLGNVDRRGYEVGGSYTLGFEVMGEHMEVEPFLRYGELITTNLPERFTTPETWDRKQWAIALILRPLPVLALSIEYLILDERAGTSDPDAMGRRRTEVDDDQLLIQLAFEAEVTP